jgi:hypothetical protein
MVLEKAKILKFVRVKKMLQGYTARYDNGSGDETDDWQETQWRQRLSGSREAFDPLSYGCDCTMSLPLTKISQIDLPGS